MGNSLTNALLGAVSGLGGAAQAAPTIGTQTAMGTMAQAEQSLYVQYYYLTGTTNTPTYNAYTPGAFYETPTATAINYGTNTQVWQAWNEFQQIQMDAETLARVQREHERLREEYERQQVEGAEASRVARELLLELLTPEQQRTFIETHHFDVRSQRGRTYRLYMGSNTALLGADGLPDITYCIHTSGVPREDELLGFKLLLEANEEEFLRVANPTQVRARPSRRAA